MFSKKSKKKKIRNKCQIEDKEHINKIQIRKIRQHIHVTYAHINRRTLMLIFNTSAMTPYNNMEIIGHRKKIV